MSDKHHRYYKHTKFRQNPIGDPKFLVDLTMTPKQYPFNGKMERAFILVTILMVSLVWAVDITE